MSSARAWVAFDLGATSDEIDGIADALAELGVEAEVSEGPYSLVASADPTVTDHFVVIATAAASGFLGAMVAKAGSDAYQGLARLVGKLRAARRSDNGRITTIIRGEDHGPDIRIDADTPETALRDLLTGALPEAPSGVIAYDPTSRCWRDAGEIDRA